MADPVQIVEPSPEHIPAIARLERASFKAPWRVEFFASEIGAEGRYNRIAQDESGEVVGYLFAMFFLDEMHVNKIAVAEAARRHGIARSLMADCVEFARSRKVRSISLEVRESNTAAQLFYNTLDFHPTYIRRRYYPDGESAVVMTAKL